MDRIPGLRKLFRHEDTPARVRRDVDEEIAWHLDAVTAELVAAGHAPQDARRLAEQRFGDLEQHRRALRAVDTDRVTLARWRSRADDALRDLQYAARGLLREPLFTLGAVLTLGIGLAANATMFGVIDRLLLRPPPHVRDGADLSLVYLSRTGPQGERWTQTSTSYADFATLRDSSGVVARAAAFWITEGSLDRGTAARKVSLGLATGDFFAILGTQPSLGRWFARAEDDPTVTEPPAVLSHALWRAQFAGDSAVLGRRVRVDQHQFTVVGIAPPGFHGPQSERVDLWVPMRAVAVDYIGTNWETSRNNFWLRMVAQRKAGVSAAVASERATVVHRNANRLAQRSDSLTTLTFASMVPARGAGIGRSTAGSGMMGEGQSGLSAQGQIAAWLGGVAVVVLLIVCANLANLLLSRASRRRRELAVRLAMGVRRGRLVRQLLSETVLLSVVGGILGLLLTWWGSALMRRTLLSQMAWDTSPIDGRVVGFTALACLTTALVAGLVPALLASRQDLTSALKSATHGGGHRRTRLQRSLLVAQAALSVVLLAGAGLFVRSLQNVAGMRLGYDSEQVLVANIDLSGVADKPAEFARFWSDAMDNVGQLPSVLSVAMGVTAPFNSSWATDFSIPGRDSLPELRGDGPYVNAVSARFLETMGTRVVRGRGFGEADVSRTQLVAVVNQVMADKLWPAQNPLGKCVKVGGITMPCSTIIGVTENTFRDNLRETPSPQYLVLLGHKAAEEMSMRSLFIRTSGDAAQVSALVRDRLQTLRPDLPFADVRTLQSIIEPDMQPWKLGATMFGLFGVIALVVAVIGLYAVVAYDVSQRWHELGVRAALGARPQHLLGLIVGDGVRHALIGLSLGVAVAWLVAPLIGDMLYHVPPRDPGTYGVVAVVLLLAAVAACALPGRRASRVAPAEVLRGD